MIIVHNSGLTGDPTTAKVEIDRRMLDFCVGLDTEFSEIVEGSHLYYPKTRFEQVSTAVDVCICMVQIPFVLCNNLPTLQLDVLAILLS